MAASILSPSDFAYAYLSTPVGLLELKASDAGLAAVTFLDEPGSLAPTSPLAVAGCLREAHRQLQAYFGRELRDFSLLYDQPRGTEFQQRVWHMLQRVGYGRTASYLDLARLLENPGAVRAVGAANGQNPLAIVWPCHRIIGASGQLTGYAGGLPRKKWLLAHEQPAAQGELFG
ncbi:methylated-DNA--[protein]-cysteine S-methyltransferase [Hymenobacter metallicola]|uniref:Methylated-DNA--protein-cysteine methyltransferase n=1 Tax=Hymenobacter metallicola TaxID=2563114 RepID=A0A4Z0QBU9_9BACT|nr:methylated-DNA--[protein]-cysteine S-methyltransferase [Hymenobacter metallicola]TGE27568.1 methylated-DNA--[protein]-cysteine S-methyltransferase [Hymenobacter metallicola]